MRSLVSCSAGLLILISMSAMLVQCIGTWHVTKKGCIDESNSCSNLPACASYPSPILARQHKACVLQSIEIQSSVLRVVVLELIVLWCSCLATLIKKTKHASRVRSALKVGPASRSSFSETRSRCCKNSLTDRCRNSMRKYDDFGERSILIVLTPCSTGLAINRRS